MRAREGCRSSTPSRQPTSVRLLELLPVRGRGGGVRPDCASLHTRPAPANLLLHPLPGPRKSADLFAIMRARSFLPVIGSGAVASYFSSLKTSTLTFPTHPSIALGVPLAFFGLSGAFLSALANLPTFDDRERPGELDARKLAAFLAVLVTVSNVLGAAGLRVMPSAEGRAVLAAENDLAAAAAAAVDGSAETVCPVAVERCDEETALLRPPSAVEGGEGKAAGQAAGHLVDLPFSALIRERSFWVLGAVLFFVVGPVSVLERAALPCDCSGLTSCPIALPRRSTPRLK
jgi:hypothetical protein